MLTQIATDDVHVRNARARVRTSTCTYLMQARVLDVVRRHLLLAFDLDADVKSNSTGHRRLVGSFLCIEYRTTSQQSEYHVTKTVQHYVHCQ